MTFKKIFKPTVVSAAAIATIMGAMASTPAKAVETINMTAIDGYPPKALWVKLFISYYIPTVNKRLAAKGNYKIKWNQAWAGQIVKPKHVMGGMQKGLGDIGIVTTVFHADKVPLQMVAYATPFVTTNPDLVSKTIDKIAAKFPEYKAAWTKRNQVYLTNLAVLDSYQLFSSKPLKRLSDLKGMKIAGAGMNLRYLKGMGAAGVGGSLVGYYNKLKTGVVDAAMIWPEAAISFKLVEVAPHMLDARIGSVNSKAITVNANTWKKLPKEVQDVLATTAIDYRNHTSKTVAARAISSYVKFEKKGGTIVKLSDIERNAWANTMPNVAKSWAAGLEKKGIPGKAVLKFYMDTMRAAGETIPRQWDKE